jgi:hypothetical protein
MEINALFYLVQFDVNFILRIQLIKIICSMTEHEATKNIVHSPLHAVALLEAAWQGTLSSPCSSCTSVQGLYRPHNHHCLHQPKLPKLFDLSVEQRCRRPTRAVSVFVRDLSFI